MQRVRLSAGLAGLGAAVFAMPQAGLAQDDLRFDISPTVDCLHDATEDDAGQSCIGEAAKACMAATPMGETTIGMGYCLDQELAFWDAQLNAAYKALMAAETAEDKDMADLGASAAPQAPALRDMQRAWITFRDATCDYERAQWGGGTGGGPATLACLMRLTGEQTLYLEEMRVSY